MLNKFYGIIQARKCLFNILCDNRFDESEADRRVFHKFDDGERVEMVVFTHVGDILTHAQVAMERFDAELEGKFKVKLKVETFGIEKISRTSASSGVSTLSPSG